MTVSLDVNRSQDDGAESAFCDSNSLALPSLRMASEARVSGVSMTIYIFDSLKLYRTN